MKVVEVHWNDAFVDTDEISQKGAQKLKPYKTVSIGQLFAENEHGVVMVVDSYPKAKKKGRVYNLILWENMTEYWEYEDI